MIALDGQVHVVAGAGGGGIGTAIAVLLARAGATVIAIDRTDLGIASAKQALEQVGTRHRLVQLDLADEPALMAALAEAGPVRGLVNVVGGITRSDLIAPLLDDGGMAIFEQLMRFNTVPTLAASRAAARAMTAHGQGGSIVNLVSAAGIVGMPFGAGYAAAKAALINLTLTMAAEWGASGIRVNAVAPGSIATAKIGRERYDDGQSNRTAAMRAVVPLGRRGVPEDVAGVILFLLSDLASYVTGQTIGVDGGILSRPPYNDAAGLPLFMSDPGLRERLSGGADA